ncbi:MAG: hypothetical protein P8Y70_20355 [Candidatus Lokiarchaeota archaeon]
MSIILYKIKDQEIIPTDEIKLSKDNIYIIVDKHMKRPKIWVWSGLKADISDRYFAGVSATRIKSQEKLYGASIEVVESGNEPESFPILEKNKIVERHQIIFKDIEEEADEIQGVEKKEVPETKEIIEEEGELVADISKTDKKLIQKYQKTLDAKEEKVVVFLEEMMEEFGKLTDKIRMFLETL